MLVRTGREFFPEILKIDVASGMLLPEKAVPKTTDLVDPERFISRSSTIPYNVVNPFDTIM